MKNQTDKRKPTIDPGPLPPDTAHPGLLVERNFASSVRRQREARGLTQAALARAMTLRDVPLSQSAVAKLEREDDESRRPIRLFEAAALAWFFEHSIDDMVTGLGTDEVIAARRRHQEAAYELVAARQALAEAEAALETAQHALAEAEDGAR